MIEHFNTQFLLEPQIEHTCRLIKSIQTNNFSWDASSTGTGKTYCAAAMMRYLKRKFVVISPKLNIPKWNEVLKMFGVKAEIMVNYEKLARGNYAVKYDGRMRKIYRYKVKGQQGIPHFLRGEFCIPKDWIVILDEFHRCKGYESLNAGLLFALKNQGYTTHALSATAAMTPLDLRASGYAMNLHKGMHTIAGRGENYGMNIFKQFATQAGGAKFTGRFGAMYFDSSDAESVEKLQAIRDNLFNVQKIASRMNREDFGNIFPKNQVEATSYDMGDNGKRIKQVYEDMQRELAMLEERSKNYRNHIFAIIMKARRHAELLKVPSLAEMCEDLYNEGKSIAVFLNFTDSIEALENRLSKKFGKDIIGKIYGEQTYHQRFHDISGFQGDKKRFMLVNIAAGAEAVDLQDITGVFPRAALVNPSFRAIAVVQSIGRIDRAYAKSDCLTRLIMCSGTIEDNVAEKFNNKKNCLDILNNGDMIPDGKYFGLVANMF